MEGSVQRGRGWGKRVQGLSGFLLVVKEGAAASFGLSLFGPKRGEQPAGFRDGFRVFYL
jgi:hypothetical protein